MLVVCPIHTSTHSGRRPPSPLYRLRRDPLAPAVYTAIVYLSLIWACGFTATAISDQAEIISARNLAAIRAEQTADAYAASCATGACDNSVFTTTADDAPGHPNRSLPHRSGPARRRVRPRRNPAVDRPQDRHRASGRSPQ